MEKLKTTCLVLIKLLINFLEVRAGDCPRNENILPANTTEFINNNNSGRSLRFIVFKGEWILKLQNPKLHPSYFLINFRRIIV